MHELFPIVAGMVIGLIARRLITTQLRIATLVLGSTFFGAIASFMSGELLVSLAYLAFDAAQVLIVALCEHGSRSRLEAAPHANAVMYTVIAKLG